MSDPIRAHSTDAAPAAIGPYSQSVSVGGFLFTSGQIGLDPASGKMVEGGFEAQAIRAFQNVKTQLNAAGIGPTEVTKLTHYVVDLDEEKRSVLHGVAGGIWPVDKPAATLLGVVRLAREGMLYEVDVQAVSPD